MTPTIEDVLRKYMLNDGRADIIYFEDAVKAMTEYASLNRQGWKRVEDGLPDEEINVLCYHSFSSNYFICYRTKDCTTNKPKWYGGAMPTHWQLLTKP